MSEFSIFANHAHLFPEKAKENAGKDALLRLMDECGIEKAVCFATFPEQIARAGLECGANRWLYGEIKNEPSLVGFGTIDFGTGNLKDQVKEIKELGFYGIKIHPAYQGVRVDSKELFEVYSQAEKEQLFISFHTGLHWHRICDYEMLLFDEVAWHFPKLKFSLEHVGGYSFFKEALLVMNNNSRNDEGGAVYAGLTSVNTEIDEFSNVRLGAWSLSDDEICTLIYQTGEKRSIFGLDFPYKNAEYTKTAIKRIKNLPISDGAKRGILGDNLREALGL